MVSKELSHRQRRSPEELCYNVTADNSGGQNIAKRLGKGRRRQHFVVANEAVMREPFILKRETWSRISKCKTMGNGGDRWHKDGDWGTKETRGLAELLEAVWLHCIWTNQLVCHIVLYSWVMGLVGWRKKLRIVGPRYLLSSACKHATSAGPPHCHANHATSSSHACLFIFKPCMHFIYIFAVNYQFKPCHLISSKMPYFLGKISLLYIILSCKPCHLIKSSMPFSKPCMYSFNFLQYSIYPNHAISSIQSCFLFGDSFLCLYIILSHISYVLLLLNVKHEHFYIFPISFS